MDESTQTKTCCRCDEAKPTSEFYKRSKAFDGLNPACKSCLAQRRRIRRAMSPEDKAAESAALASRPTKVCTSCGIEKARSEFRVGANGRDGMVASCKPCEAAWHHQHYLANREAALDRSRAWYEANRDRRKLSQQAWYEANKDRVAENQRRWAAANPGARARLVREWRANNPEHSRELDIKWRAANRERLRELGRAAYAADPIKFIEASHRRRATIARVTVGPVDYDALWTGACGICADPMDRDLAYPDPMSKSVDHIVPLARGGSHTQTNLQWAHLRCNISKGTRLLDTDEGVA